MAVRNYEDLIVWQKAYQLCSEVYALCDRFPRAETYGLGAHMRRTAVSPASNIAEGHERRSGREFLQFIKIALGSLAELRTQLLLARDRGYISDNDHFSARSGIDECRRLLYGLKNRIRADM